VPSESSHFAGNPKLIQKLIEEIAGHGPLTFARFMEETLYNKEYGYYMTQVVEPDQSSRERIGWEGDFFTAPELSPILAKTLVRKLMLCWGTLLRLHWLKWGVAMERSRPISFNIVR